MNVALALQWLASPCTNHASNVLIPTNCLPLTSGGQISLQQLDDLDVVPILCPLQGTLSCVVRNSLDQLRLKDCQRLGNSYLSPVAY